MLHEFVEFRKEIVTKRSTFELNKAIDRLHLLEGLKTALDHIDEVIAIIRVPPIRPRPARPSSRGFPSPRSRQQTSSRCGSSD
jgi:DNA gyrase/topoisomerase IV subunit A